MLVPGDSWPQKGAVKGGFYREALVHTGEQTFDLQTGYNQDQQESFMYCHAVKNGSVAAIREQAQAQARAGAAAPVGAETVGAD